MNLKSIKKTIVNTIKKVNVKATSLIIGLGITAFNSIPAHAVGTLEISGMEGVASSMQNLIKYVGLFFLGGGAIAAFYGTYKLIQSVKSQDSESRSTAIIEVACGLGAVAVGAAASTFAGYITL
jgi:hypothetical protein